MHKPVCRERQAVKAGVEWARAGNKSLSLTQAAFRDDTRTMKKLIDGLVAAVGEKKHVAKHSAAAVKAFVDFQDKRQVGNATYNASGVGGLKEAVGGNKKFAKHSAAAVKAFVDSEDPRAVGTAAYNAAQEGALKAMRLLHKRGANLDLGEAQQGGTPSAIAAQVGRTAAVLLLAELRASRKPMECALSTLQRLSATSTPPSSSSSCAPTSTRSS